MVKIKHLAIGTAKSFTCADGKEIKTGICKERVSTSFLAKEGFRGDGVADLKHHGGADRAVCIYPYEHYEQWQKEFSTTLASAAFGENITVTNMLEKDIYIGDVFQIGDAVVQVTQPRVPCSTITKRTNVDGLLKRIVETGYTGYLCRVLQEGEISEDATIHLVQAHPAKISVAYCNDIYFHQPKNTEGMEKILAVGELAEKWRKPVAERLDKLRIVIS
ncbi:sulfurase [Priestia koreensis]|uniref:Sulfurase n=1 Tax=Priestia koreensis TaxID=284581 RepID=A0A0M0LI06_9BACI|nr:MOSC domain-containing protein [Priestia koreensis]KOO50715.1 sulfurase [Priestia koreensis]